MDWRISTEPALPGKLKLWCMQFGLLPRFMWPLTLYEVPPSKVEKLEKLISSYASKWLGLPRCISSIGFYGKGVLELPISSLSEEYKCAKVRLEMMLGSLFQRPKLVVEEICRQGEATSCAKVVAQEKPTGPLRPTMTFIQEGEGQVRLSASRPDNGRLYGAHDWKLLAD